MISPELLEVVGVEEVSLNFTGWNRVAEWLRRLEILRARAS